MTSQKKSIRIGLDIDGTIRDIYTPLLKKLRERNPDMDFPPVSHWECYEIWKSLGLSEEALKRIWFHEEVEYIYLRGAKMYENVYFSFAEIILISGQPNQRTRELTLEWLKINGIPYDEIHFTTKKHLVQCDYYIEDSPAYLEQLVKNVDGLSPSDNIIKIKRPWNKDAIYFDKSFDTVKEAIDYIKKRESNEL